MDKKAINALQKSIIEDDWAIRDTTRHREEKQELLAAIQNGDIDTAKANWYYSIFFEPIVPGSYKKTRGILKDTGDDQPAESDD